MNFSYFNWLYPSYSAISDKDKMLIREYEYLKEGIEKLSSIFEYGGDLTSNHMTLFELANISHGVAAMEPHPRTDKICPAWGTFDGIIREDGLPERLRLTFPDGVSIDKDIDEVAYCFNTKLATADRVFLQRYAEIFANIDQSLLLNLFYSRNIPIPIVASDNEKKQYEHIIESVKRGETTAFSIDFMQRLSDEVNNGEVKLLKIFEVEATKNIQDLSRFWEDMKKRQVGEMGVNITIRDKRAQTSSEELNAFEAYNAITITDKREQREAFCDRLKRLHGVNCTVKVRSYVIDDEEIKQREEVAQNDTDEGTNQIQKEPADE